MAFPTSIDQGSPATTDSPGLGDDQIRALKLFIEDALGITDTSTYTAGGITYQTNGVLEAKTRWSLLKGAAIASGSTITPGTDGNLFHITGTVTITAIASINGTGPIFLVFDGAALVTHNGTSLILQDAANYTTAAGDILVFIHEGSGNWREINRFKATSSASVSAASQAEMETASSTTVYASPGRTKFNPGVAKAWLFFEQIGTQSILASYGVTSITDDGTGLTTVTFSTVFSSANYAVATCCDEATFLGVVATAEGVAGVAGSMKFTHNDRATGAPGDSPTAYAVFFGDQ